jgi:hypothetical protein
MLEFPQLDGSSREPALFTMTLIPTTAHYTKEKLGSALPPFTQTSVKQMTALNYRLRISGLESACSRVAAVDAISVKGVLDRIHPGRPTPTGNLEISDFEIKLLESYADDFLTWMNSSTSSNQHAAPHRFTLELLDSTGNISLFKISTPKLGILRYKRVNVVEGIQVNAYVNVKFFTDELSFTPDNEAVSTSIPAPDPKTTTAINNQMTNGILNLMDARFRKQDMLLSAQRSVGVPDIANASDTAQPELVARRLLASVQSAPASPVIPKREAGTAIGASWAASKASLDELKQVAALETASWTGIRLTADNSLLAHLSEAGILPPKGNGPLDLHRDEFIEGIVAGAAQVLRSVEPHLAPPALQK